MTEKHKKMILAMAENDMNVVETAKKTFYGRWAIDYNARLIEKETGLSMKKFYDLCKLVEMARCEA